MHWNGKQLCCLQYTPCAGPYTQAKPQTPQPIQRDCAKPRTHCKVKNQLAEKAVAETQYLPPFPLPPPLTLPFPSPFAPPYFGRFAAALLTQSAIHAADDEWLGLE